MGKVRHIYKWDLRRGVWTSTSERDDRRGKALSIVQFDEIVHDEQKGMNYVIIADGCRFDNHSRDLETFDEARSGIANVLSYFEEKKENYRIEVMLLDNDAPLKEESRLFAAHICSLAGKAGVDTVNFIGISKGGMMALELTKYLFDPVVRAKTRLYSVGVPYKGSILAEPVAFEAELQRLTGAKIKNARLADKLNEYMIRKYLDIYSCSHLELDISRPEGVPQGFKKYYDPSFLGELFAEENIVGACKVAHFQNIVTKIGKDTLKETLKAGSFDQLGMFILNDLLYKGESDGIVSVASQKGIEEYLPDMGESTIIESTHQILKTPLYANQLLDIVEENMAPKRISLGK